MYVPTLVANYAVGYLISSTVLDPALLLDCNVLIGISDMKFANPT